MNRYVSDTPLLWETLGLTETASVVDVKDAYLKCPNKTPETRWAYKVLSDPIINKSYSKYRSSQAMLDAGFFDDLVEPENRAIERDDLNFLTTPVFKIVDRIKSENPQTIKPLVVLLSTGSFNPIHEGHIQMMESAKVALEKQGRTVVGGYLSLGHDDYSLKKYADSIPLSASHRLFLCEKAVAQSDWLMIDPWEARYNSIPITYTEVISRLEKYLAKHIPNDVFEIYYVFGGDNAGFARAFVDSSKCVVIPRPEHETKLDEVRNDEHIKRNERIVFADGNLSSAQSSSALRTGAKSTLNAINDYFWDWKASIDGTEIKSGKYFYAVRNDIDWATSNWQKTYPLENWEEKNKLFHSGLSKLLSKALSVRQSPDPVIDCTFVPVNLGEQQKIVSELDGDMVLNLDVCTNSENKINFSRLFGVSNGQYFAKVFVGRPGFDKIESQLKAIKKGKYLIIDDDIASGRTIELLKEILPKGVILGEKISLLQKYLENNDQQLQQDRQLYDIVDGRDFLIGSTHSGLVVALPNGDVARAPYMSPYVSLRSRAKVLPANEVKLSIQLWKLNLEYLNSLNSKVILADTDPAFQKLMEYVGFKLTDKLTDICGWHIKQLTITTGETD